MTERDRLFLGHVLDAIAAIENFTAGGRSDFMSDLKTQSTVVRQIERLEATRRERLSSPRTEAERRIVHLMRLEQSARQALGSW